MKNIVRIFFFFTLTSVSCAKKKDIVQSFSGNLEITSTNSPLTGTVGQNIISSVTCQLPSISGSVKFQGFDIKEVTSRQFHITAKAFFKDWNTQISMPVIWTLDTTSSIRTTSSGIYILNFYNSTQLFKSDTVQVN